MTGIESVSTLTNDNQQRMEDMAALAEETSASTEEIASASAELAEMAGRSRKMIEKFRLNCRRISFILFIKIIAILSLTSGNNSRTSWTILQIEAVY
jgi:hypothetical protein